MQRQEGVVLVRGSWGRGRRIAATLSCVACVSAAAAQVHAASPSAGTVDHPARPDPALHRDIESRPLGTPASNRPASDERRIAREHAPTTGAARTAWALAGVLALIAVIGAGVRVWARRSGGFGAAVGPGGRSPAGVLEVLGRYPVGRGATLVLLKIDRRILLLAQGGSRGGGAFTTLCELTNPEEVASILVKTRDADGESLASRFRSLLTRFDRDMGGEDSEQGPDHGRRIVTVGGVDRAELWDASRGQIPVVDVSVGHPNSGAVSRLRDRIASLGGGRAA